MHNKKKYINDNNTMEKNYKKYFYYIYKYKFT